MLVGGVRPRHHAAAHLGAHVHQPLLPVLNRKIFCRIQKYFKGWSRYLYLVGDDEESFLSQRRRVPEAAGGLAPTS